MLMENQTNEIVSSVDTEKTVVSAEMPKKEKKSGKKAKIIGIVGVIIVAILAILILTSSSPSEKVMAKIEKIGAVSLDSVALIEEAEQAYAELEEASKPEVINYETLKDAREKYDNIKEVYDVIEAIGEVKNSEKSGQVIGAARDLYKKLSSEDAALITNCEKLEQAEKTYSDLQVENTISLIEKIGKVSLKSETKIKKARETYTSLSDEAKKEVKNYKTLTKAEETLKKLKKEKAKAALGNLRKTTDKVEGITWYEPTVMPKYTDTRCFVLPYIGQNSYGTWLRMKYNYTGDDWIFFKKVIFLVDGKKTTRTLHYFNDIVRDNQYGVVWEVGDLDASDELDLIENIINSKETIVRFQGDEYRYDHTVSASDKKAMKQVLDAYKLTK